MLTEASVRTAVANGIDFIHRTREPYGLLFLNLMHRRFGVPQFADALKRYDEVIAERPNEAPLLRVLRRIADANNPVRPEDWDHVQIHGDRMLVSALYCDRLGLPPAFAEVLEKAIRAGGYHATHALLAWIWMQDNRCQLAVPDGFVEEMYRAVASILETNPTMVNDLKLEAAAFLSLARQGKRVNPGFVRQVVSIQRADGGWGKPDTPDPANPDGSSWHSTILALLLLLHVEFPAALQKTGAASKRAEIEKYGVHNYDDFLCLRPSPLLIACVIYLCRGLVVFVGFGVAGGVPPGLSDFVATETLTISALAAAPAALILYALIARAPTAPAFVRWAWKYGRALLSLSALSYLAIAVTQLGLDPVRWLGSSQLVVKAAALLEIGIIAYVLLSSRVRQTFRDFPAA
jgi:hypothetical protein